jgi:hypothetical protein
MPRRARGRASVQRSSARQIMATLSDRFIRSTRPLAAGWKAVARERWMPHTAIRDGARVECPVITTRMPAAVLMGTRCSAEDQEPSERRAVPSLIILSNSSLAIASRSGATRSTGYWRAWCRFDVVYPFVAHRPLDSREACEVWELVEEVVRRCAAPNGFYARETCGCRLGWC